MKMVGSMGHVNGGQIKSLFDEWKMEWNGFNKWSLKDEGWNLNCKLMCLERKGIKSSSKPSCFAVDFKEWNQICFIFKMINNN